MFVELFEQSFNIDSIVFSKVVVIFFNSLLEKKKMSFRIVVSDSEQEDEETQLNLPQIEEEEVQEEQKIAGSSRAPSVAWLCFDKSKVYTKNGKEFVKCNQPNCKIELQFNRTTASHLVRHVKKMHSNLLPKSLSQSRYKQQSLELHKAKVMPVFSEQRLKDFLVRFFVVEDISFQTVESLAFRELLHFMRPGSFIPKADSLKNSIMTTFKTNLKQMRAFWAGIDSKISFTTDIWSAPNDIPFMAITGHWIDRNFKMRSMLMDFVALPGSHAGTAIEKVGYQSNNIRLSQSH